MREAVSRLVLPEIGTVTVSIGVASAEPADQDELSALRKADANLYKAKANGRNQVADDASPSVAQSNPALHVT